MQHYTSEQFREGSKYKADFFHEYSAKVYALASSHIKEEQAARAATKAVFIKAFNILSTVEYDGDDYWPLLKGYVMEEVAAHLNGRQLAQVVPVHTAEKAVPSTPHKRTDKRAQRGIFFGFNIFLSVALIWLLLGLLTRLGVLHGVDLGYSWFNQNVFLLF